jgi:hypothetical protein
MIPIYPHKRKFINALTIIAVVVCSYMHVPRLFALEVSADECGKCHVKEFILWSGSAHSKKSVTCKACHQELHSASLAGCRNCHSAQHKTMFTGWPEVNWYDVPNAADYFCLLCHESHKVTLLKNQRIMCFPCHGSKAVQRLQNNFHNFYAKTFVPLTNDGFEKMQHLQLVSAVKNRGYFKIFVISTLFLVCLVIIVPYGIGVVFIYRKLIRKKSQEKPL